MQNKKKIINDPVHGFITIAGDLVFDLIEHPYFQRLRRISQLGLSYLVYPGALHTRFNHALGSMHLMQQVLEVLQQKGVSIEKEEAEAAIIAILLHDIGHGPFSHALENSIIENTQHEAMSEIIMNKLNDTFDNKLSLAISIYKNKYHKKFLHQLVSGQLDVDRLDYLSRDSFFTGVSEGIIGIERIIKMLNVIDDELVVDCKGIYSIEKFIISRRLMYWQVYLHKTVISAEQLLIKILNRAKYLAKNNQEMHCPKTLRIFLENNFSKDDFKNNSELTENFLQLDDFDIISSIKIWQNHSDKVLSLLSKNLINRKLYKITLQNTAFDNSLINQLKKKIQLEYNLNEDEVEYFVFTDKITNLAYSNSQENIKIAFKDKTIKDISEASDQLDANFLDKIVVKYFLCEPK